MDNQIHKKKHSIVHFNYNQAQENRADSEINQHVQKNQRQNGWGNNFESRQEKEAILSAQEMNEKIEMAILKMIRYVKHLHQKHKCDIQDQNERCKLEQKKVYQYMCIMFKHNITITEDSQLRQKTTTFNFPHPPDQQQHSNQREETNKFTNLQNYNQQIQRYKQPITNRYEEIVRPHDQPYNKPHQQNKNYLWDSREDHQQNNNTGLIQRMPQITENKPKNKQFQSTPIYQQNNPSLARNQYGVFYRTTTEQQNKIFKAVQLYFEEKKNISQQLISQIARLIVNSKDFQASKGWVTKFIKRYPILQYYLSQSKIKNKAPSRAQINESRIQQSNKKMMICSLKLEHRQQLKQPIVIDSSESDVEGQENSNQSNRIQQQNDQTLKDPQEQVNHVVKSAFTDNLIYLSDSGGLIDKKNQEKKQKQQQLSVPDKNRSQEIQRFKLMQQKLMRLPQFIGLNVNSQNKLDPNQQLQQQRKQNMRYPLEEEY